MLATRKAVCLVSVVLMLCPVDISASHYLAPSTQVKKQEVLDAFTEAVDAKKTAHEAGRIPLVVFRDGDLETEYISSEELARLRSEDQIAAVVENIVSDPDTGEEVPRDGYYSNNALSFLLNNNLIEKAYVTPATFIYVSKAVRDDLADIGWTRYALIDSGGKPSYDGNRVLVYKDGLQNSDLRKGIRLDTVRRLIENYNTPEAQTVIMSAFAAADAYYQDRRTADGDYLIDDALSLAIIVTGPVNVKAGPELTAAALLCDTDRAQAERAGIKNIPESVWRWLKTFNELNGLEFIPPRTARKPKVEDVYIQNYIHYLIKYAGDTAQPLLLLMAYRMDHFLAAREEMGAGFYDRYNLLINIYSMLAEQLGLKDFSDSMNSLSFRKANEKQYRAILRHLNRTYGVYYRDLSVFAGIFHEVIAREMSDLEKQAVRKIPAEILFGVKDPGSIDEKIKYYARKYKRAHKHPLDGIAELTDLVRGRIVVDNEKDLALIWDLPFVEKLSPGATKGATAVAHKVIGAVPAVESIIDEKYLRQLLRKHPRPKAVKEALARYAKARSAGKAPLFVELQLQTRDMSRREFTGTILHSFYKMKKRGYDLLGSDREYYKTADIASLTQRMRDINSEPQVAGSEFIRCRYPFNGETVEFYHNVPRRITGEADTRPAVIDVLTRRDMDAFRSYLVKPHMILVNGNPVRDLGQRIATGDLVEIRPGTHDPALQKQIDEVIRYAQGNGDRQAAGGALHAGNVQSKVAVELLLGNIPDSEIVVICTTQLERLKERIISDSNGRAAPGDDDEIRSCLEPYNLSHWAFRRSQLLRECCLAVHFGFISIDEVANAYFCGRGWKTLNELEAGITPVMLETVLTAAGKCITDEIVTAALKPLGAFPAGMPVKDRAALVAIDVGKGIVPVAAVRVLKEVTDPSAEPSPAVIPALPAAITIDSAA